jgi:hypothetical protein
MPVTVSTVDTAQPWRYSGSTDLPSGYYEPLSKLNCGRSITNVQNDRKQTQTSKVSITKMDRFVTESLATPRHFSVEDYPQKHLRPMALRAENSKHQLTYDVDDKRTGPAKAIQITSKRIGIEDIMEAPPSKFARSVASHPEHDKTLSKSPPMNKNACPTTKVNLEVNQENLIAFDMLQEPIKLYHEWDDKNLTQLQCFIRKICIDVFTVTKDDVQHYYLTGKNITICVGQVGFRCSFCRSAYPIGQIRGSIYFPSSIKKLYSAAMNLIQRHFSSCPCIPANVKERYYELKQIDGRSGASRVYWTQSAANLGLFDTAEGIIRYCAAKVIKNGNQYSDPSQEYSERNEAMGDGFSVQNNYQATEMEYICWPEDQASTSRFTYFLLRQMTLCAFTEGDRLGKRRELPLGFGGIACRHCISDFGTGRFFPSSIKTMSDTTKTLNILHAHLLNCGKCPTAVKDEANELRKSHEQERTALRFGSQTAFFSKIWCRLHPSGEDF